MSRTDPRAFAERTALAWNRSALALALVGAVALRSGQGTGLPALGEALSFLLFATAAGAWLFGGRLYARRINGGLPPDDERVHVLRILTQGGSADDERVRVLGLLTAVTMVAAGGSLALALIG